MNSKMLFLSVLSATALISCNSNEKDSKVNYEPVSCSVKQIDVPVVASVKPKTKAKIMEGQKSSDGLLTVVRKEKKTKVFMGNKAIETNFDLSANIVAFERINQGPVPEYFLLTNNTFNGDREELMTYSRALHCKLVDSVLQIVPMQTYADETQQYYDTADVYSIYSINDFQQNEEDYFGEEEDAKSYYLEYNAAEKSFIYKETFRDFLEDESTEGFYEEVGKFQYKNGVFYQVKEKMRKI